ncbi:MAG: BrnA antitoxin family protein [Rhodobacteraceae bacterium]|nr:BrnA antitoxin family protein [Paracoccaceae bacterium]
MPANPHRPSVGRMARRSALTRTQRLYFERLRLYGHQVKQEEPFDYHVQSLVPEAWDTLEKDIDVDEAKVKVTLLLDTSVAKFYRAMGRGYQSRINRILATFAQMRIGQIRRLEEMTGEEIAKIGEMRE